MDRESCEERIDSRLAIILGRLKELWERAKTTCDNRVLYEYGVSFDYVAPDTFEDQPVGYFRWQLSYGGPTDEFRIYADRDENWLVYHITFWLLDWFDGASRQLRDPSFSLVANIFSRLFVETGAAEAAYRKAIAEHTLEAERWFG